MKIMRDVCDMSPTEIVTFLLLNLDNLCTDTLLVEIINSITCNIILFNNFFYLNNKYQ